MASPSGAEPPRNATARAVVGAPEGPTAAPGKVGTVAGVMPREGGARPVGRRVVPVAETPLRCL